LTGLDELVRGGEAGDMSYMGGMFYLHREVMKEIELFGKEVLPQIKEF
jgi:hypothetical protein